MKKNSIEFITNMIYIFSVEKEQRINLTHIQNFKEAVSDELVIITERRFIDFVFETMRNRAIGVHHLPKNIYYELMCISYIGIAILELVPRHITFFDNFQKLVDEKVIVLPEELKEYPKTFTSEFPFEPFFKILSREIMNHINILKEGLKSSDNKLEQWCNNMNLIICKLVEKSCGKLIIKMLEEEKGKELKGKNRKQILDQIDCEIALLESNIASLKETSVELQEYFYTNMKLLNIYVYIISIMKIFKIYKPTQTFLILIDEMDYSMFISLFSNELKHSKKMTPVKIFGNITIKESCKLLDKLFTYTIKSAEEYSMAIANELVKDEKEKQSKTVAKNREKEEKRRLRLEQENLAKERLKQENLEKERLEQERLKQENLAKEKLEQERLEQENLAKERLEQERLEQENLAKERLEQENLAKERLEQENLAKERLEQERLEQENLAKERLEQEVFAKKQFEQDCIKEVENQRIAQIVLEEQYKSIKKPLKFNPATEEFVPLSIRNQGYSSTIQYQIDSELKIFKSFPCYFFRNPQSILKHYFDNYPGMFKHNELQAYYMAINHLFHLWNNLVHCYDYRYRDTIYQQFKNLETAIIHIANL
jgi:uncharacterized protein YjbI with pentapeptide repeats